MVSRLFVPRTDRHRLKNNFNTPVDLAIQNSENSVGALT